MARFAQMPLTLKQNLQILILSRINSRYIILCVQVDEPSLFVDEFYICEYLVECKVLPYRLLIKLLNNASLTAFVMRKTRQLVTSFLCLASLFVN